MIDHVSIAVRDLDRAGALLRGGARRARLRQARGAPHTVGFGKTYPEFWINPRPSMAPIADDCGAHVALRVRGDRTVDASMRAALAAGGSCDGAPGLRRNTAKATMPPSSAIPTATASKP